MRLFACDLPLTTSSACTWGWTCRCWHAHLNVADACTMHDARCTTHDARCVHAQDATGFDRLLSEELIKEYVVGIEVGDKNAHHHGEACFEVMSCGGEQQAIDCLRAMLLFCMPVLFPWVIVRLDSDFIHDKGVDRSVAEAMGYCIKGMPDTLQASTSAVV